MYASPADILTWLIAAFTATTIIVRPFGWPEAIWAAGGAVLVVVLRLLPLDSAVESLGKGADVYLFLLGMMLLSEVARREGVFDWTAEWALTHAQNSPRRLFFLIYAVGVIVTAIMSNDATAVVLTPAVFAAVKKVRIEPLPYLFTCAFVANAASFVLPISNPANIVLYGGHTPPLLSWLRSFALPSLISIVLTYVGLQLVLRNALKQHFEDSVPEVALPASGKLALAGIVVTALALVMVSILDIRLGLPTAILGLATSLCVLLYKREGPVALARAVSWSVIPLVGGLFVLVAAIEKTGAVALMARWMSEGVVVSQTLTAALGAAAVTLAANIFNNLPVGLLAASTIHTAAPPPMVTDALLIGVDLGPNISVSGSLATLLWLIVIRREDENVGFWRFLRIGLLVTPPALVLAVLGRLII